MAGERSTQTDPKASADQPPTDGEPSYEPEVGPGGDVAGSDHEEPIDGARPDPDA